MDSFEANLKIYLNVVDERRTWLNRLKEARSKVVEFNKQIEQNNDFADTLKQEIQTIYLDSIIDLDNYKDLRAMLIDTQRRTYTTTIELQKWLALTAEALGNVRGQEEHMKSMKYYFKKGKVLDFERHRSKTQNRT